MNKVKDTCKKMDLNEFVSFKDSIHDQREIVHYLFSADICVEPAPDSELNRPSTFFYKGNGVYGLRKAYCGF